MGLQGTKTAGKDGDNATYLGVAGGYIWDKSKDKDDPNFTTQEYKKGNDEVGVRSGASYGSIEGTITGVRFNTHEKYGESIIVSLKDSTSENFLISISTNNRYSQDMMKGLLLIDFSKSVKMTPYDTDNWAKKQPKRNQGISFIQDGEKIQLKIDAAPFKGKEFWAENNSKKIKRFFEDLTDWLIDSVTARIEESNFESVAESKPVSQSPNVEAPVAKAPVEKAKAETVDKAEELAEEMPEVSNSDLDASLDALLS